VNVRYLVECEVLENNEVAPEQYRMIFRSPELAGAAKTGQFCMIEVAKGLYPFLRRPMCFERILEERISILYKVEGEGTALMAKMRPGGAIGVQGPLGNGFPLDASFERHIIVAGGIGVATFPGLAEALVQQCGVTPEVILAARAQHLILCADEFRALGCRVYVATDDGSAGKKAFASQMLERLAPGPRTRVYACGPMKMMETTAEVAVKAGADCLVSLEAQMACGDGACLGCVVESKRLVEGEKMVRVCLDGPVFDATLIDWEAHNTAYDVF
jgi:dihydroorotate dehydrogenase electron transfer subunit